MRFQGMWMLSVAILLVAGMASYTQELVAEEPEAGSAIKKAESLSLPKEITNSISMKLKLIPAGEFMMGSPESEKDRNDDEKQHRVRITKPYYLGVHEVTQGQWKKVMGTEPWSGKEYVKEGSDYAASYVSWKAAQEFCKKLNSELVRAPATGSSSPPRGYRYALPTEAQWEYACRAGTKTAYSFGNDSSDLGKYAWYRGNVYDIDEKYAHRVGLKRSNAWGLYDMHGNVWEWCSDWYANGYSANAPTDDPTGPSSGSDRVYRGGSWINNAGYCRSANRRRYSPGFRFNYLGFRIALVRSE